MNIVVCYKNIIFVIDQMIIWICCVNGLISVSCFVCWNRFEFKMNFYIYVYEIKMKIGGNKNIVKKNFVRLVMDKIM